MRLVIETRFESGLSEAGVITCNLAPLVIFNIMASRDLSALAVFLLAFAGYPLSFCTTLKRLTHTWITNEPSTLRLEIGVRFSVTAYYSLVKEKRGQGWIRTNDLRACARRSFEDVTPLLL